MALSGVHSAPSCECSVRPPAGTSISYPRHVPEFASVILTGGRSSRMGSDKAGVIVSGAPMGEWVHAALERALPKAPVLVLGASRVADLPRFDDGPGSGPLSGLAGLPSALAEMRIDPDAFILVAVDHPWVLAKTLQLLAGRFAGRPVVPVDEGTRQVTCAVYPRLLIDAATQGAERGIGFQRMLDEVDVDGVGSDEWAEWSEDGRSWFSVDRPEDIQRGLDRFGKPGDS